MGEHRKQIPADKLRDYSAYPALITEADCQHTLDVLASAQHKLIKETPLAEGQEGLGRDIAKAWLAVLTRPDAHNWASPAVAMKTAFCGLSRIVRSTPGIMDEPTTAALKLFAGNPPTALPINQTFTSFCSFVTLEGAHKGSGATVKDRKKITADQLPKLVTIFDTGATVPDDWQDPHADYKPPAAPTERYGYRGKSGSGGTPNGQMYRLLA